MEERAWVRAVEHGAVAFLYGHQVGQIKIGEVRYLNPYIHVPSCLVLSSFFLSDIPLLCQLE